MSRMVRDPDRLAELEAERDFLMRSLDDLERERDAGNVEAPEYERLRDDYTARAAAVLRAIRDGIDARPIAPAMPRGRKILVGAVLTVFAAVAAVALATQMGDRRPGQSLTGNAQEVSADDRLAAARRDVEDRPNDSQTHLAYAHALVGSKDFAAALKEYDTAFRLDPKNAEARAYGGWLLYLVSDEVGGDSIAKAMKLLDEAIAADPQFPDSHFFRGMVLLRGLGQPAAAATEFETYLAASPNGPYAEQVRALLEQARGGGTTTTSR